ncbi:MAG: hypothetical protein AAGC93_30920 [Cyanobacteria bacterium P01_F01_bin.53]
MKVNVLGSLSILSTVLLTTMVPAVNAADSSILTSSAADETLYLDDDEIYPDYALEVEQATEVNGIQLPVGTLIYGQYEPAPGEDDLIFVAESFAVNGRTYSFDAVSERLEDRTDPRDRRLGEIAKDAAIGAAGGALLSEILGDIDLIEVLGGAAAGVAVGQATANRVVVIKPDDIVQLKVQ